MSKNLAVPLAVRKSAVFSRLKSTLAEFDVKANVGRGKRHWFLEVQIGHTPRKHYFPTTAGDPRTVENNVAQLRRVIATARASLGEN